jgi:flavin-dependent dehydrogenase
MTTRRNEDTYDAVVIGAGSAGAATAWQLARRGLRVALVDRRPLGRAGARWRNAIPAWMFYEARVPRPVPPELRGGEEPVTLLSRGGEHRFRLPVGPYWQVDMGRLVDRLQALAIGAGATLLGGAGIEDVVLDGPRPVAVTAGGRVLRARLFVDASGMAGALCERVPELDRHRPAITGRDVCHAVQRVAAVRDPEGAAAFAARIGVPPGEVISWIGLDSGFSTLTVGLDGSRTEVDLLAGSAGPGITADEILGEFVSREPWIGEERIGGTGTIPLRHPFHRLAAPGIVALGDAGCMVYSAHGSGVGFGFLAARMLAEVVTTWSDPGCEEATWAWQARFQRKHGPVLAAADLFRRAAQDLGGDGVAALMEAGFVTARSSLPGLQQRLPGADPSMATAVLKGLLRAPRLTARFAPVARHMLRSRSLYASYPRHPDMAALRAWSHATADLFEQPPDVA